MDVNDSISFKYSMGFNDSISFKYIAWVLMIALVLSIAWLIIALVFNDSISFKY